MIRGTSTGLLAIFLFLTGTSDLLAQNNIFNGIQLTGYTGAEPDMPGTPPNPGPANSIFHDWAPFDKVRMLRVTDANTLGVLDAAYTVIDSSPFRNGAGTVRIGGQGRGGMNRFINGRIDEVRIYNSAKTAAQIQADMNTPLPGLPLAIKGGGTPTVLDVQAAVNQAMGITSCSTGDVNGDGYCNILDIQRIVNGTLGK